MDCTIISRAHLKEIAGAFAREMEDHVRSIADLEGRVDTILSVRGSTDHITFPVYCSGGKKVLGMSYCVVQAPSPIELRANPSENYLQIIVRFSEKIEGYKRYHVGPNFISQNKRFEGTDLGIARDEVVRLSREL
jgi:hypothetical protein